MAGTKGFRRLFPLRNQSHHLFLGLCLLAIGGRCQPSMQGPQREPSVDANPEPTDFQDASRLHDRMPPTNRPEAASTDDRPPAGSVDSGLSTPDGSSLYDGSLSDFDTARLDRIASAPDGSDSGGAGSPFVSKVRECAGPTLSVGPGTISSVIEQNKEATLILSPGTYGKLSFLDRDCIKLTCKEPAVIDGTPNRNGCRFASQIRPQRSKNIIIENLVFVADTTVGSDSGPDYGVIMYQLESVRIANNAFNGKMNHDISTKERVGYAEVVNNLFVRCMRHCIEIGQNGNIRTRPSTSETMIVSGNVFDSPLINGLTQRYNRKLVVDGNEFRNVAAHAVHNWPYWQLYPFGAAGDDGTLLIPTPPLRTDITNNRFIGKSKLLFDGRGVRDDVVLIKGNTGDLSCSRAPMDAGTAKAHGNEETTDPPRIDPSSDVPCN